MALLWTPPATTPYTKVVDLSGNPPDPVPDFFAQWQFSWSQRLIPKSTRATVAVASDTVHGTPQNSTPMPNFSVAARAGLGTAAI